MSERRAYAAGTFLTVAFPWGIFGTPGRVLCDDGKLRALVRIAPSADTFFSVPAAVRARGKTVAGYVGVENETAVFHAYLYRKNHGAITRLT